MRPMKWIEWATDESEHPHVIELYERHGLHGYFFWMRLNETLGRYFNFWAPGCYKFKTVIFYSFFNPQIKDSRTIRAMLKFLHDEAVVFNQITGRDIYLYYPEMEKRCDRYTKTLKKTAEDRGETAPESASNLAFWCVQMLPFHAKSMPDLVKRSTEDKEFKSKLLRRGVDI